MADKPKEKTIDDFFNDKMAQEVEGKFASYQKWEESKDELKKARGIYDSWHTDLYKKAEKAIEEVAGGLDKELNFAKHGEKLKDKFAGIMIGYLEKAMGHLSETDNIEFHELKERIKAEGLKGQALFDSVSQFYNMHTGVDARTGRSGIRGYETLSNVLDTMLRNGKKGEDVLAVLREQHNLHALGAQSKYRSNKFQEIMGNLHPTKARMYLRKNVMPQYGAAIKDVSKFHENNVGESYALWKGFKHGDHPKEYEELGVKYKPVPVPKQK